jgi:medium-chain acyl-[acyl-carrier-protein] hydrolase
VAFSQKYLVHYYEVNNKRKLTLPNLIHYFEDMAVRHSDVNGFSLDYYDNSGCGFMLLKWDIKILFWPLHNDSIEIKTWPSSFKRFLANREFEVFNNNGQKIVEAHSVWLFADTRLRKPRRVPEEIYAGFNLTKESEEQFYMSEDIPPLRDGKYKKKIIVQDYDIDTNNHVNNVRYIEWALISLPAEAISGYSVSNVIVNYKKELYVGDQTEIISDIMKNGNSLISFHSVYNMDKDVCNIKLEWVPNEN